MEKRKSVEIGNYDEYLYNDEEMIWLVDEFHKMRKEADVQFEEIFDPQKKPPSADAIFFGGSVLGKKRKISLDAGRSKKTAMGVSADVVMEILVQMPPKSVFKGRCLSKIWNESISNPFFLRTYAKRRKVSCASNLLGFAQITTVYTRDNPFLPLEPPVRILPRLDGEESFGFPRTLGCFISWSNCLVLCGKQPVTYNVLNLLTKRWATLPSPHNYCTAKSVELVCEEESTTQLVTHYKVIRICAVVDDEKFTIETYSSRTGRWAESVLAATCTFPFRTFVDARVLNGVYHSSCPFMEDLIAVFDDIGGENRFQLIEKPLVKGYFFPTSIDDAVLWSFVFSRSSSDGLLWCGAYTGREIQIWMLPKGENGGYHRSSSQMVTAKEWRLVHTVSLDFLLCEEARVGHLYMLGLSPWNPLIALFRIEESIFLYNSETQSLERVSYHGQPTFDYPDIYLWLPYFESPFLSLYANA